MAYEQKDNTGSLFKNDRREKDTHAHAKGTALIDGVEYWVDAWTNEARDGSKYQSLKFKRKLVPVEDHKGNTHDPRTPQPAPFDDDEAPPF